MGCALKGMGVRRPSSRHESGDTSCQAGDNRMMVSDYEKARLEKMAENKAMLELLGIDRLTSVVERGRKHTAGLQKKRKHQTVEVQRRSLRAKGMAPSAQEISYSDDAVPASPEDEVEGAKLPDGTWRGERFGDVKDVFVGQVFGAGDYQRQGRFEMSKNGFFVPQVQPEWLEPGKGCYSIILNNDNGLSRDEGDTIVYAGGGGRHRGQNRSATQSFHQTWDNQTNAALRLNHTAALPVRVIRGPKLPGPHGTQATGGGFRYDGLYHVTKAELLPTGSRNLRTALFTLSRIK